MAAGAPYCYASLNPTQPYVRSIYTMIMLNHAAL